MNIEELDVILNEKREIQHMKFNALLDHIKNTMNSFIADNHLDGIAKIQHVCESSVQIEIPRDGKYGHTFDLYFHMPYFKDARKLEMNFGCFGSFKTDDVPEINYCIVIGTFASHLKELEQQLILSDEAKKFFDEYETAYHERYKADDMKRDFIAEQKKIEDDNKRVEFAAKLFVGAKIECGTVRWNNEPNINEIEHITAKNIIFKNDYGKRTKKEFVLDNLVSGRWKLV